MIIPPDCVNPLAYICDADLRKSFGINSVYVFASNAGKDYTCLLYTSPSPRDAHESRMPSSA